MASGQARTLHEKTGRKVVIVNQRGIPQWSDVFEHNPRIARRATGREQRLLNCGGARPYITAKTETHWTWRPWTIRAGELYLCVEETAFAAPYAGRILVEPNTKIVDGNKAWPFDRWQALVDRIGRARFVQTGKPERRCLDGVAQVVTTFRQAAAILAVSRAFVGPEGALHHAAAALGVPAVVLWSEFIAPEFTGYATQRNLRHAGLACGARVPCAGCRASMAAISVDEVATTLEEML